MCVLVLSIITSLQTNRIHGLKNVCTQVHEKPFFRGTISKCINEKSLLIPSSDFH